MCSCHVSSTVGNIWAGVTGYSSSGATGCRGGGRALKDVFVCVRMCVCFCLCIYAPVWSVLFSVVMLRTARRIF